MFTALARLATSRPKRVLGITVVFFALAGVLGGPVAGLLNTDNDSFSDTGASSAQAIRQVENATGQKAAPDLIVLADTADTGAIDEAGSILEDDPDVAMVVGGPDGGPQFVSKDGSQTYLAAIYAADADADETTEHLRDQLERVDGVTVGGFGPAYQQVNEQVESDLLTAELIAFPLLFLVSLWVFRSAVAALLPLLVGGLTIVTSMLVIRGINEVVDISIFALNLITGLGLGLAIDYSLFLVSRYREELDRVGPGAEAIRRTVATAGRTVAFSALTVAGAGLALLVFPLRFLYSMGIGVTIVALVSAAVSLIVLPSLFAVLEHRVNSLAPKRWQRARAAETAAEASGFWFRLAAFVMRFPVAIALSGAAILLAFGAPFLGVKFTGVDAGVLPDGATAKVVDETLRTDFVGAESTPIIVAVEAPESAASDVAAYATELGGLPGAADVLEPRFLGSDTWQVDVVPAATTLDEQTLDLVGDIRDVDAPGTALVGGPSAEQVDQVASIAANIPLALTILSVLTLVTLFLLTGSVVLPVKALIMNVLTIGATFGILVLIFQDGRFEGFLDYTSQGALESSQPVFLFAVVFGLSTDYAVFLLTRIKEARDNGAGEREAVALGLQRTGRIVTAAALLFAIALGSFATSQIIFIKELGVGTALAVLIDATIVRAMLVPSLMALLGRRNWWAPAPLRRLHERFGLDESLPPPATHP
ncbi:MMPL family transporter [Aeromicrobium stalagmiti]|uniref:MMPL family transporter n=1 Tax=Aeromicrobium stalagmiti TaxID=2738988 RepID=UPI00156A4CE8|nr:MMPL family transporter [Aeromicrobium stalagmiti]NRQ49503.1 MMPL family transporter [Aeromicrobium stalagmiti]